MIAYASAFPDSITLHASTINPAWDDRRWIVHTDDGVSLYLTEQQADDLGAALWNRNIKTEAAA